MQMNNRMEKHALTIVAYTTKGFACFIPLFIYNWEPFFGSGIIHKGKFRKIHITVNGHLIVFPSSSTAISTWSPLPAYISSLWMNVVVPVSYTHLRAHETVLDLVCRL